MVQILVAYSTLPSSSFKRICASAAKGECFASKISRSVLISSARAMGAATGPLTGSGTGTPGAEQGEEDPHPAAHVSAHLDVRS